MPEIVKALTKHEKRVEKEILDSFPKEKICAYFLSKNLRSIYQFDDEFIDDWYQQLFDTQPHKNESKRAKLALEYTRMLLIDKQYNNHMKYWIRQLQSGILEEMNKFFAGEPGK
ncbi:hypothetical protein VOI54_17495 [Tamlana sp. 2201CG12-4]|uniref:hypothetical protein n=1 Tax=Tamlana sp. 2201CG12-4 TaxID=3112582 RepID=UPI002DC024FB|nr:hypothetical protein [Tamlana sp. 2201CG12-4]MEC3908826.1 hypothetical protein [Tamlana sp. 2201CG12-4]